MPSVGQVAVGCRGLFDFFARPNPKKWLPSGRATNTERLFGDTPRLFHESCRCVAPKSNPGPTISCAAKTRLVAAATRIVLATNPIKRAARETSNLGDDPERYRGSTHRNHLLPATRRAPKATEHGVGGGRRRVAPTGGGSIRNLESSEMTWSIIRDEKGHGKAGRTRRLKAASNPKTIPSAYCSNGDLLVTPGTEHAHPAPGEAVLLARLTACVPAVLFALVAGEVPPFADAVWSDCAVPPLPPKSARPLAAKLDEPPDAAEPPLPIVDPVPAIVETPPLALKPPEPMAERPPVMASTPPLELEIEPPMPMTERPPVAKSPPDFRHSEFVSRVEGQKDSIQMRGDSGEPLVRPCATGYFSGTSETAVNRSMRSEPNVKVLIRTGIVANTQVFFCLLFDHQDVACSNRDVRASRVIAGNRVGTKGHIGFNVVVTRS